MRLKLSVAHLLQRRNRSDWTDQETNQIAHLHNGLLPQHLSETHCFHCSAAADHLPVLIIYLNNQVTTAASL